MIKIAVGVIIGMTVTAMAQVSVTIAPAYLNALAHGITSGNEYRLIKVNESGEVICMK